VSGHGWCGLWNRVCFVGLSSVYAPASGSSLLLAGDRLGRALTGPRIGVRTLAANRQTAAMTQAAIAAEIHQPLDVHRHLAPQIALDHVVAVDRLADLQHLSVGELVHPPLWRNTDLLADLLRELGSDTVNILESDDDALLRRNVNASDTGHVFLLRACGMTTDRSATASASDIFLNFRQPKQQKPASGASTPAPISPRCGM